MPGRSLPGWFIRRAHFRSSFLIVLGAIQIPYGIAMVLSQRSKTPVHWWPGAEHSVDGIPVTAWGIAWIAIGAVVLVTCRRKSDNIPFALSVMLNFLWASLAIQRGLQSPHEAGAWGPGVVYLGISIGVLMISAWPDPITVEDLEASEVEHDSTPAA